MKEMTNGLAEYLRALADKLEEGELSIVNVSFESVITADPYSPPHYLFQLKTFKPSKKSDC